MATTHLSLVQSQAPLPSDNSSPKNNKVSSCIQPVLVGLGIIILIGSLVACGFLYPQVGGWFLAACGGGLIGGLILIAIGLCCGGATSSQEQPNMRSGSLANTGEIADTKGLTQSPNRPRVPRRASDIKLPEPLPDIPPTYDILGNQCIGNLEIYPYIEYLATEFPDLFYLNRLYESAICDEASIDYLKNHIFKCFPSWFANFNHLNIPIPLRVTGNHWALVYIDRGKRIIEYYDSKKNYGNHKEIVRELTEISEGLSKQEPAKPPYRVVCKIKKVLQPDGYQCGPWVLFFLEYRLIDPEFDFNQLDIGEAQDLIKKYRMKIVLTLIDYHQRVGAIYKEERKNYLQYYKDPKVAQHIHKQDVSTFWISQHDGGNPLKGRPLIPFQTEELAVIREEERRNYLQHYKDQKIAGKKLQRDLCTFLTSPDRNNSLKGRPLIPVEAEKNYKLTIYS